MNAIISVSRAEAARAAGAVNEAASAAAPRGRVPATSGIFSARIDERSFAITRGGDDKGSLTAADILAQPIDAPLPKDCQSADTQHRSDKS